MNSQVSLKLSWLTLVESVKESKSMKSLLKKLHKFTTAVDPAIEDMEGRPERDKKRVSALKDLRFLASTLIKPGLARVEEAISNGEVKLTDDLEKALDEYFDVFSGINSVLQRVKRDLKMKNVERNVSKIRKFYTRRLQNVGEEIAKGMPVQSLSHGFLKWMDGLVNRVYSRGKDGNLDSELIEEAITATDHSPQPSSLKASSTPMTQLL